MYKFLFKTNKDERDCVAYIDVNILKADPTCIDNHYNINGANYSMSLKPEYSYADLTTILSENEFNMLCAGKSSQTIIDKLNSKDNEKLFEQVQQEEIKAIQDEYCLSEDDVKEIFNYYYLPYRDRGIISCVFDSIEDAGHEEAFSLGYASEENERWFNFEQFGKDLLDGDSYYELSDGSIVYLNY